MSTIEQEPLLQYAEMAKLLNVSVQTLKNWVRNNKIPYVRLPARFVRFNRDDVLEWVASQAVSPPAFSNVKEEKRQKEQIAKLTKAGFARHGLKTPVKENNGD